MNTKDISSRLLAQRRAGGYPPSERVISIVKKIRAALFPEFFLEPEGAKLTEQRLESLLLDIYNDVAEETDKETATSLINAFVEIQQQLYKDAQAGFDGDPAAQSVDEVILSYPGFFAVFVYRIAHFLFLKEVPLIPRMMSEYAHSITGIDIHPGAEIGEYFFIDHGTGVVIGETSIIGNQVKLYQGVTIGALSLRKGQGLKNVKRHPTIQDRVTVYSGASILGGETVIGEGSVIGGNAFIVKSISEKTVVKALTPELQYEENAKIKSLGFSQADTWFYEI